MKRESSILEEIMYAKRIKLYISTLVILLVTVPIIARPIRWYVREVSFEGNRSFKRSTLLSLLEVKTELFKRVRFSESRLRSDLHALERFYKAQGFFDVSIQPPRIDRDTSRHRVSIAITIYEGERTRVSSIQIVPGKTEVDSSIFKSLKCKPGRPLIRANLQQDAELIEKNLANRGYLEADVEPEVLVDSSNYVASVVFKLTEGPLVTVDDVRMKGVKKLSPRVVHRELFFKPGDTLTLERLRKSERQLYRTNLFSLIRIEPVLEDSTDSADVLSLADGSYPVMVSVDEADFFRVELGVGYGTQEGLRSSLKTSYNNIFSLGHRLALKGSVSQRLQSTELIYSTLWLWGLPLQFDGSVYYTRHDDIANTYFGIFKGLRLAVGRLTDFNLGYQFWLKWEDVEKLNEKNTQSIGASLTYDTRNDLLDPSKGFYNLLQGEVAGLTRKNSSQFIKITNDARLYWQIKKLRFGSGLSLGWAHAYGTTVEVPTQEQFFIGGPRSVRGFEEGRLREDSSGRSLSGTVSVVANVIDFQFPLFWWFRGAAFLDGGYVWDKGIGESPTDLFRDMRWSAGPGIRLQTPVVVVRFDAGFKLDRRPGESRYVLHFDVGQPF